MQRDAEWARDFKSEKEKSRKIMEKKEFIQDFMRGRDELRRTQEIRKERLKLLTPAQMEQ
eukprot:GSA120T00014741001.1